MSTAGLSDSNQFWNPGDADNAKQSSRGLCVATTWWLRIGVSGEMARGTEMNIPTLRGSLLPLPA